MFRRNKPKAAIETKPHGRGEGFQRASAKPFGRSRRSETPAPQSNTIIVEETSTKTGGKPMNILDYAASVPTPADWTAAFQQAIADLRTRGGGTLIVPAGDYPTGAIRLYDNMTLHIESGAVLRFHQDASAFPLIDLEFEGIAGLAHQPCIYAEHAKNVTITGYGTLDGQGSYWWTRQRAGQNAHPRPYLVCFNHCEHVTLENVTLTNSPAWTVHHFSFCCMRTESAPRAAPPATPGRSGSPM